MSENRQRWIAKVNRTKKDEPDIITYRISTRAAKKCIRVIEGLNNTFEDFNRDLADVYLSLSKKREITNSNQVLLKENAQKIKDLCSEIVACVDKEIEMMPQDSGEE